LIQVVFDPEKARRRKSSLVTAEAPARRLQRNRSTACFVHSLLENQRRRGDYQGSLDGISETLRPRGVHGNAAEERAELEQIGDPKGGDMSSEASRRLVSAESSGAEPGKIKRHFEGHADPNEEDPTSTHSRLLTKKQLSDMAWGVRELSKRLASVRLKLKVKNVFILTKAHDETLIEKTREVARWLLSGEREVRYNVYVEENLKNNKKFNAKGLLEELAKQHNKDGSATPNGSAPGSKDGTGERRLRYWNNEMCRTRPHTFDFVVTLGGDGTVLYASWLFQRIVPPVLSFALGSLGFLTKFDYEGFRETLVKAFRDGVLVSLRLRFEGTVMRSQKRPPKKKELQDGEKAGGDETPSSAEEEVPRDLVEELVGEEKEDEHTHKPDGTYEILNDIVVDRGPNPSEWSLPILPLQC
jgi:NAD+ kinase